MSLRRVTALCGWLIIGCTYSNAAPTEMQPRPRVRAPGSPLTVSLTSDSASYAPGQPIKLTLLVSNPSAQPVTVQFGSSQRYDFTVEDGAGKLLWRWAADRVFAQDVGAEHLGPHATLAYHAQYSDRLAPGRYRASGILVAIPNPLAASVTLTIERR